MALCPLDSEGIHRLGNGLKCGCGYEMRIPPILVSIEVSDRGAMLVNECFNCDSIDQAIDALRAAADKLEAR